MRPTAVARQQGLRELREPEARDAREHHLAHRTPHEGHKASHPLGDRRQVVPDRLQPVRLAGVGQRLRDADPVHVSPAEERLLPGDVTRDWRCRAPSRSGADGTGLDGSTRRRTPGCPGRTAWRPRSGSRRGGPRGPGTRAGADSNTPRDRLRSPPGIGRVGSRSAPRGRGPSGSPVRWKRAPGGREPIRMAGTATPIVSASLDPSDSPPRVGTGPVGSRSPSRAPNGTDRVRKLPLSWTTARLPLDELYADLLQQAGLAAERWTRHDDGAAGSSPRAPPGRGEPATAEKAPGTSDFYSSAEDNNWPAGGRPPAKSVYYRRGLARSCLARSRPVGALS